MVKFKRLPIEGIDNIRDLGGFSVGKTAITKWGVFLRSENPADMIKDDLDYLYDYGIRTFLDLKMVREYQKPEKNDKRFKYINIPVIDDVEAFKDVEKTYGDRSYVAIVETCKENLKSVFEAIAENTDNGGILFHCLVGKDRTGLVAMFLLSICGVSKLDILADYIVSIVYLQSAEEKFRPSFDVAVKHLNEMDGVIEHLNDKYGSAENYLKNIGVSGKDIEKLRQRLTAH